MSIFDKIANSQPGGDRLPWLDKVGNYVLEVQKLEMKQNRQNQDLFIAELGIVSSTNEERPNGSSIAVIENLSKNVDIAPGNVKKFFEALLDDSSVETMEAACGDDQAARCVRVGCEVYPTKTKDGRDFAARRWFRVTEDNSAEDVASRQSGDDSIPF